MSNTTKYSLKILSSLAKVFPESNLTATELNAPLSVLKNDIVSFQAAFFADINRSEFAKLNVDSPLKSSITVRNIVNVTAAYPAHTEFDDNYLRTQAGLYPDLLSDLFEEKVRIVAGQWRSIWVEIDIPEDVIAGDYPVTISLADPESGEELCSVTQNITVINAVLPEQTLIRTEWFHGDCLADFYNVPVFSEEHWRIMKNFIRTAVKRGINMILTPTFTPPLDTNKGGERTTIQLIDVNVTNGEYSFNFDKFTRFIEICREVGVKYFEIAHLFTQWGAACAPKIMATVDGQYRRIFGWDTPAVGGEYTKFLHRYLPELTQKLCDLGINKTTFFHISDEPTADQIDTYLAAKNSVCDYLKDFVIMDALSDYEFYKTGAVEHPICSNNHIHSFIEHNVKHMWSYYCTSQCLKVSNRFMAMPSARNRIYGVQLFKYDIEGCLHWGYNFYNSQYSLYNINPYQVTDSGEAFPSGDPFLVYPKADGTAEESIRIMVFAEAMSDLRAMNYLAKLKGKDFVMNLIEGEQNDVAPITFEDYPKNDDYLLNLRNRINKSIESATK